MAGITGVTVDLTGLQRASSWVLSLGKGDRRPLMEKWMAIILEDNTRGVLAGTDKDGKAMPPVTYRPVGTPSRTPARPPRGAAGGASRGNNLSPEQYRRLGGPPLAPRGASSRVITNYHADYEPKGENARAAFGYFHDVVSAKGVPFLRAHFEGLAVGRRRAVKLPRRDLRGLRPEGSRKAREAARDWMKGLIRLPGLRRTAL